MKKIGRKTFLVILSLGLLLALLVTLYLFNQYKLASSTTNIFGQPRCATEGESTGSCADCMTKCCDGLVAVPQWDTTKLPPPGMGSTCKLK